MGGGEISVMAFGWYFYLEVVKSRWAICGRDDRSVYSLYWVLQAVRSCGGGCK